MLEIQPSDEIRFELQVGKTLEKSLKLKNAGSEAMAFKVKTTAPKRYCVRPNCSVVKSGGTVEVKIVMQPIKEIPPQLWKDKFLIQSTGVPSESSLEDAKALFDKVDKECIVDQKLLCAFDLSPSATQPLSTAAEKGSPSINQTALDTTLDTTMSKGFETARPSATQPLSTKPDAPDNKTDLAEKLELERQHAERLAKELREAKKRELALEREVMEEKSNNRDTLRALEELQKKFQELQARSMSQAGSSKEALSSSAPKPSDPVQQVGSMNNLLLLLFVTLVCIFIFREMTNVRTT